MASINRKSVNNRRTHNNGPAHAINAKQELKRSVLSCLLWEDGFYESGQTIADRIKNLIHKCPIDFVAGLAIEARTDHHLRHTPLLMVRELFRHNDRKHMDLAGVVEKVIQRPDEIAELLSIYWQDRNAGDKARLPKKMKNGLRKAFNNFNEYQFAKWNNTKKEVKLVDALRLVHPKPKDEEQDAIFGRIRRGELKTPDTWEVALSSGADKCETFTRLLNEKKLGYMALLRNLRNMRDAGVAKEIVANTLFNHKGIKNVLPFRFLAAAKAVPSWEDIIDDAMKAATLHATRLSGKTVLMLDHSGSMNAKLSSKSDLRRADAAAGLAILLRAICDDIEIIAFSGDPNLVMQWRHYIGQFELTTIIPNRTGMALRDAYFNCSPQWGGTQLGLALQKVDNGNYDRLIVITDEQSSDVVPMPKGKGYMINVASNRNGVGYGKWNHIDGFSESVVTWISELENSNLNQLV